MLIEFFLRKSSRFLGILDESRFDRYINLEEIILAREFGRLLSIYIKSKHLVGYLYA
jgi:hypothetical protein